MSEETTSAGTEATTTEAVADAETTLVTGAVVAESEAPHAEEAETTEAGGEAEAEVAKGDKPEGDDGEDNTDEGAPEEYAEFTMPEGIELDGELAGQFKTVAKELNLTQDQAQKVADLAAQMRQRDVETIVNLRAEWVDQTKADKEIGGDKLDANLATAKKAIDAYGSPQFIQLLNESGLGNHPEVVRFMAKAGRDVSEDRVVPNRSESITPQGSLAERLFKPAKE